MELSSPLEILSDSNDSILHIYQVIVAQDYLKESADTVKGACYQELENVIFFIYVFSTYIILSLLNHKQ